MIQYIGTGIRRIDMEHFINIQIPVPSIIRQFEITSNILALTAIFRKSIVFSNINIVLFSNEFIYNPKKSPKKRPKKSLNRYKSLRDLYLLSLYMT